VGGVPPIESEKEKGGAWGESPQKIEKLLAKRGKDNQGEKAKQNGSRNEMQFDGVVNELHGRGDRKAERAVRV
jgi:hypothetical protein